jgi:hypothetical protein
LPTVAAIIATAIPIVLTVSSLANAICGCDSHSTGRYGAVRLHRPSLASSFTAGSSGAIRHCCLPHYLCLHGSRAGVACLSEPMSAIFLLCRDKSRRAGRSMGLARPWLKVEVRRSSVPGDANARRWNGE